MKKYPFTRIVSLILALSILLSSMTVLSYAEIDFGTETPGAVEPETIGKGDNVFPTPDGITVLLNRTYDEGSGYGYGIGITSDPKNHKFEVATDDTGNKYFRM